MRAVVKKLIPLMVVAVLSANITIPVQAGNLEDANIAYNNENYTKAIELLKKELAENPDDPEAYHLLAKSYEGLFKLKEAMEAYKTYDELKRRNVMAAKSTITPLPSIQPDNSAVPTAQPTLAPVQNSPVPSYSPLPSPSASASATPMPSLLPSAPAATSTPIPALTVNNDKVAFTENKKKDDKGLILDSRGWEKLEITSFTRKKKIALIPKDSPDLQEITVDAGKGNEFVVIQFNIKYNDNILIKADSDQIVLKDYKDNKYHLYALSTYVFKYRQDQVSQKVETLLVHDYYQLSVRDSRNKITMVFKVPEKNDLKELQVLGYKNINLDGHNV